MLPLEQTCAWVYEVPYMLHAKGSVMFVNPSSVWFPVSVAPGTMAPVDCDTVNRVPCPRAFVAPAASARTGIRTRAALVTCLKFFIVFASISGTRRRIKGQHLTGSD